MRIFIHFFLFVLLTCSIASAKKIEFAIGLIDEKYIEYNFIDAKTAFRKWVAKISKLEDANISIKIFDSYEDYHKAVLADEVQNVILSPELYLRYSKSLKETHYDGWMKEDKKQLFSYKLIGKKNDYKSKKHLHVSYYKNDLIAKIVLEKISLRDDKIFTYHTANKDSKALLDTFFNKSDIALVSTKVWKINCELNPQIGEKLQVLDTTDAIFMKIFSLISKKMPLETKKNYFEVLSHLHKSTEGKQMMRMFKFNTAYPITTDDLAPLENYYKEYLEMKRKK